VRIDSIPATASQKGGAVKGCLGVVAIIALALIGGCLYFQLRRPHFNGIRPLAIDVVVHDYATGTNEYRTTITNPAACDAFLREFTQARPVFGSEMVIGTFTFRYDSGKTDAVGVLHGFPNGYYSILQGGTTYRMPFARFRELLKDEDVPWFLRRSVGHYHHQERAQQRLAVLPVLANSSSGRHRLLVIRIGSPIIFHSINRPNNCVEATPDYACCEFLRPGGGAPDAKR
jgi:hypothetical protein